MKFPKSKAQIRQELEQATKRFVLKGGKVEQIEKGISGIEDYSRSLTAYASIEPRRTRTSVDSLIKKIEAKKQKKKNPLRTRRQPQRKLIKDDFGEPIRWVWEE